MDECKRKECGRYESMYCPMCVENDLYVTKEEYEQLEAMCDLMCSCDGKQ